MSGSRIDKQSASPKANKAAGKAATPPTGPIAKAPSTKPLGKDHAAIAHMPSEDPEAIVQDVMAHREKGFIGQAEDFWHAESHKGGWQGIAGKVMGGLLSFSGLPQVENSAAELGARVGAGDSKGHIAKTAGKLAFDSGMVLLNGIGAGKVVSGMAKGAELAVGGARAAEATIVRHYTSEAAAKSIMESGEIWASKAGSSGLNKVYFVAENAGEKGMNFLRRFNVGRTAGQTTKAIEIDLAKLPPELAQTFKAEATKGPLGLENFITHTGNLKLEQLKGAVKLVDAEHLGVTFDQLLKSGARLSGFGTVVRDVNEATKHAFE